MTKSELIGIRIGRAIARNVLAEDLPRAWTGLDPQDGDQLRAAGIKPNTNAWDQAVLAAHEEYDRLVS